MRHIGQFVSGAVLASCLVVAPLATVSRAQTVDPAMRNAPVEVDHRANRPDWGWLGLLGLAGLAGLIKRPGDTVRTGSALGANPVR